MRPGAKIGKDKKVRLRSFHCPMCNKHGEASSMSVIDCDKGNDVRICTICSKDIVRGINRR
jgi:transcription elongation factor Elf1